jgi:hypothetical protein
MQLRGAMWLSSDQWDERGKLQASQEFSFNGIKYRLLRIHCPFFLMPTWRMVMITGCTTAVWTMIGFFKKEAQYRKWQSRSLQNSGSLMTRLAMATICCSPPDFYYIGRNSLLSLQITISWGLSNYVHSNTIQELKFHTLRKLTSVN